MVGSIIGGYLGDKYGRKPTIILANILCLIFGLLSSFSNSSLVFIIIRLFVGTAVGIIITICATLFIEFAYKNWE